MANSMAVSGLINQRSRLRGEALSLKAKLIARRKALVKAEVVLQTIAAEVLALETDIALIEFDADTLTNTLKLVFDCKQDDNIARRTHPKAHVTAWGGMTREVLAIMREVEVADADSITEALARRLGLKFTDETEYKEFRRRTGRILKGMYARGHLERHHSPYSSEIGLWSLKV